MLSPNRICSTPKAHGDGASLKHGDHACRIYPTDEELVEAVADFVAEGRQRGERCWYVAAGREGAVVIEALRQRGIDAAADMRSGAFRLIPSSDAYPVQNTFVPERSMRVFSDAIEQALRDGFSGFRAAAEMSWALGPDGPTEQLIVDESLLRSLFSSARVTGLCLYPRRSTPFAVLNGVLATHPLAASRSRRTASTMLGSRPSRRPRMRSSCRA